MVEGVNSVPEVFNLRCHHIFTSYSRSLLFSTIIYVNYDMLDGNFHFCLSKNTQMLLKNI